MKTTEGAWADVLDKIETLVQEVPKESFSKKEQKQLIIDLCHTMLIVDKENRHEFDTLLAELEQVFNAMLQLDFSKRLPFVDTSGPNNFLNFIFTSINLLNEELDKNTLPKELIRKVMTYEANSLILITNTQGKVVFIHPTLEKIIGNELEELGARPIEEIMEYASSPTDKNGIAVTIPSSTIPKKNFSFQTCPVSYPDTQEAAFYILNLIPNKPAFFGSSLLSSRHQTIQENTKDKLARLRKLVTS